MRYNIEPKVVFDHNRHSAILIGQSESVLHMIEMSDGEISISKMREEEYAARVFRGSGYPVPRAAELYLGHLAGVSARAREVLLDLALGDLV